MFGWTIAVIDIVRRGWSGGLLDEAEAGRGCRPRLGRRSSSSSKAGTVDDARASTSGRRCGHHLPHWLW